MIYCISPESCPDKESCIEVLEYHDLNNFRWQLSRTDKGIIVKYLGEVYFSETYFYCELSTGSYIRIENTNCLLFKSIEFGIFTEVVYLITNNYTDDIWDNLQDLFIARLEENPELSESELQ